MKRINFVLLFLAGVFLLFTSACQKEFDKLNKNPNNLEKADAATLLSNILVSEFKGSADIGWNLGNGFGQYMTYSQDYYNHPTRYQPVSNEPYWSAKYVDARNADIIIAQARQKGNTALEAVGLTLKAYAFSQLTDLWGDIPFKNALKGQAGQFESSYDTQQTVYTDPEMGILASLRKADVLLKASVNSIPGDLLFGGNLIKWRKFVNALRLRFLIRVSSKMDVKSEMQAIVNDGVIFQNASESASLQLQQAPPYTFASLLERDGDFNVKYLNSLLYNTFKTTGDQERLKLLFAYNENNKNQTGFSFDYYGGMPIVAEASSDQSKQASHFGANFRVLSNPSLLKARIITYAEQEFILAEATIKGLITGDPQAHYLNGIRGAYAEWGIDPSKADNYLTNPNVALNLTDINKALEQIVTQKWILNLNNGFEGWLEFRRTGFPALQTGGAANLNNGSIPSRFLYPDAEKTINKPNYNAQLSRMGGKEDTNYKAWWDK